MHGRLSFGACPALLVIDVLEGYTRPGGPFHAPAFEGVVAPIQSLLEAARASGIPVFHTRVAFPSAEAAARSLFAKKVEALTHLVDGAADARIDPRVAPLPKEEVFTKTGASAFFGTPLAATLAAHGIDTLVMAGVSTSGCVRATVVDALQHGLAAFVAEEAVADRAWEPHAASLADIRAKYGEVAPVESLADALRSHAGSRKSTQAQGNTTRPSTRALEGVRILDFTHMLSGPYATLLLADLGAEVIKIEPPGEGEATRRLLASDPAHSVDGMGAYFLTLGRNKKSVALDVRAPEGAALFRRLAATADAVVYNFRAGAGARLGLDYAALASVNPRIVTCSITGFGETGPAREHASFDLVAQAVGGGMSVTGDGRTPLRAGLPIGDLGGGLMATVGLLSALVQRNTTGVGQHVDISMQDAQVSLLNYMATMTMLSGRQPPASGNAHFVHVPYDAFPCADGHVILAIITDAQWAALARVLDVPDLATEENARQPGRWKNRSTIESRLCERLRERPRDAWLALLRAEGIPCAPVLGIAEALADAHVRARNMVVDVPHPSGRSVRQPGNPVKLSASRDDVFTPPPLLGADTDAVLKSLLGLSDDDLLSLRAKGVVS